MIAGVRRARAAVRPMLGAAALGLLVAGVALPSGRAGSAGETGGAAPAPTPRAPASTGTLDPARAGTWVKPPPAELARRLAPLQFEVTQRDATEPPFRNAYWDEHAPGIYVDVVSGEPLFGSPDKYDSGTGWPSFSRPLDPAAIRTRTDWHLVLPRTEVRSAIADSHLGHVFDDGPPPTGKRYCMNSAALRFVPLERLAAEGYGDLLPRFGGPPASDPAAPGGVPPTTAPPGVARPTLPPDFPPRPSPPVR